MIKLHCLEDAELRAKSDKSPHTWSANMKSTQSWHPASCSSILREFHTAKFNTIFDATLGSTLLFTTTTCASRKFSAICTAKSARPTPVGYFSNFLFVQWTKLSGCSSSSLDILIGSIFHVPIPNRWHSLGDWPQILPYDRRIWYCSNIDMAGTLLLSSSL